MKSLVPLDIPGANGRVEVQPMGLLRGARLFQDGEPLPWHRWGRSWLVRLEDGGQAEVRHLPISLIYRLPALEIAGRRVELGQRIPTGELILALLPLLMVLIGGAIGGAFGGLGAAINLHIARGPRSTGLKAALMLGVLLAAVGTAMGVAAGVQFLLNDGTEIQPAATSPSAEEGALATADTSGVDLPRGADWLRVGPFAIKIPPGWVDLSPNAPAENFAGLAPELVKQLKGQAGSAFAMDLAHGADGFAENLTVKLNQCPPAALTEELIRSEEFERGFYAETGKRPNVSVKLIDKALIRIGGAPVARMQQRITIKGQPTVVSLAYLMTGTAGRCAMVSYVTTPANLERYRPVFEASAMQARGLALPRSRKGGGGYVVGAIAGLVFVVGLVLALVLTQRRRAAPPIQSTD